MRATFPYDPHDSVATPGWDERQGNGPNV